VSKSTKVADTVTDGAGYIVVCARTRHFLPSMSAVFLQIGAEADWQRLIEDLVI
jgi:hypothetical protein